MITDSISRLSQYHEVLRMLSVIEEYMSSGNQKTVEAGKPFFIDKGIKVIPLQAFQYQPGIMESHRQFLDLHTTISGCDMLYIADHSLLQPHLPYDTEKDYALWKGDARHVIRLLPGQFALLWPHEAHTNEFLESGTLKLVFKIPVLNG